MLWLILFLPLASFVLIVFALLKRHTLAAGISVAAASLNALLTLVAISHPDLVAGSSITWLALGGFNVEIGMQWDPLAQLMTVIVTCIGALIHIYSLGYMREDPCRARYFGYLSLFMFSMLGIVLASNFVMLFMFWELVGLSSYLLIGFWYEKPSAADAGKKAFIVNKIGDFGFLLGIVMTWCVLKTINFQELKSVVPAYLASHAMDGGAALSTIAIITALLFCGAVGKSAQIPLHVWLPDAMEGPTPVSALIHAATMVAAGVYMLCRIGFMLDYAQETLILISWIGGLTALMAALWAVVQDDIKRILAYSTLSQLGYMVMAVGLGSSGSAMFHLATHAFFKALLFLCAGSVIVAMHHEQNIWKMGGIWSRMTWTTATFFCGMMALCGFILSSGGLSKDEILFVAWNTNKTLFTVGTVGAFLTAFYMGRLFFVAFCGGPRGDAAEHARENGAVMTIPLLILSLFTCALAWRKGFLVDAIHLIGGMHEVKAPGLVHILLVVIPFVGFATAYAMYAGVGEKDPLSPSLRECLATKFYFDDIYDWVIRNIQGAATWILGLWDIWVVDLSVKLSALGVLVLGNLLRCFQTGNLQTYVIYLGLALVALIYWGIIHHCPL